MLRRGRFNLQSWSAGKNPNIHRHAESTFHEGAHREPPTPTRKPWKDKMAPLQVLRMTLMSPTSRGSHMWSFGALCVVGYYAFCLSYDIKAHYLMNNNLHRELHIQRVKTMNFEERTLQLEKLLEEAAVKVPAANFKRDDEASKILEKSQDSQKGVPPPLPSPTAESAAASMTATNYEFELARERVRAKELSRQHQNLVHELADVRAENSKLKKQLDNTTKELSHMKAVVDKLHQVVDKQM
jgi:hypothetical protein